MDSEKATALKRTLGIVSERLALNSGEISAVRAEPLISKEKDRPEESERVCHRSLVLEQILVRNRLLIKEINDALQRIEDGQYGCCRKCSVEINDRELNREPLIQLCSKCREDE